MNFPVWTTFLFLLFLEINGYVDVDDSDMGSRSLYGQFMGVRSERRRSLKHWQFSGVRSKHRRSRFIICSLDHTLRAKYRTCGSARRTLILEELPAQCVHEDADCSQDLEFPTPSLNNSEQVLRFYCCALRTNEAGASLHHFSEIYHEMCTDDAFLRASSTLLSSQTLDEPTASQKALFTYCPNRMFGGEYTIPSWTVLFEVVKLGLPKPQKIFSCDHTHHGGINGVDIELVFVQVPESNGTLSHVCLRHSGDENYSWSIKSNSEPVCTYDFVTGMRGEFSPCEVDDDNLIIFDIHDVNLEAMNAERSAIAELGKFDLIENDCAQVILKLLAAGLGCPIHFIPPFLSPAVLLELLKKNRIVLDSESQVTSAWQETDVGSIQGLLLGMLILVLLGISYLVYWLYATFKREVYVSDVTSYQEF